MSLLGKYPCDNTTAPTYLSFATTSCTALITAVATVGNILVILAVYLNPNKDLRSPFNYFVANLSFADLVDGVVTAPLATGFHIMEGREMVNDRFKDSMKYDFLHSLHRFASQLNSFSFGSLCSNYIPSHLQSQAKPNSRIASIDIVVWIVSILISMLYLVVGYYRYRFIFATTAVGTTFLVWMFTNVKIFKYLRFQVKQWGDLHDSSDESLAKKRAMEWEKKITKTLVILVVLFLSCYLPSCVCIFNINVCTDCNCEFIHWVRDIQFVLVMANSGVNPFVYAWRLQNFRKSFKSILTCRA